MTITAITLENIKEILEPVRVELKPITLLFGPNSRASPPLSKPCTTPAKSLSARTSTLTGPSSEAPRARSISMI